MTAGSSSAPPAPVGPVRTGAPVLSIRGLGVAYGYGEDAVQAVTDVDLTLARGEVLGLAGESGSGKSTLVYGATRLLSPPGVVTAGEVRYHSAGDPDGVDLLRLPDAELRRLRWRDVSMVFQGSMNSLSPVFRIDRQLTDAVAVHRPGISRADRRTRARELLALVGIPGDRLRAYPHQLSGGMRQRVMIAMAMALEPDLVIMDEPTTALDVVMQRQILEEILRLRTELGFAVVFITHDLSLLIELADRIAIMYGGRIIESGAARDVYTNPQHPYTHGLLHSFPSLRGPRTPVSGIPGSPPDLRAMAAGCSFHPRCPHRMPECERVPPPLQGSERLSRQTTADGHEVACLLHHEDARDALPAELRPG